MTTAITAVLLLVGPILCGLLIGWAIRRLLGARRSGILWALVLILVPAGVVVALLPSMPVVGLWDGLAEGLLLGVGVVLGGHRVGAEGGRLALAAAIAVVSLAVLEIAVRLLLPPPPAFPSGRPHLLLADSIRAGGAWQGWDMRSREIACSVIYGDQYTSLLDLSEQRDVQRPATYAARPNARRRVLHVGDSLAFGFGVERPDTFVSGLQRLEPDVEHVNASMPGIAPDAYLALLWAWTARERFDEVVRYLFTDNDLRDLDGPYPCCDFEPLLAYADGGVALRCPTARSAHLGRAGWEWLRRNSPPPFLLRAILDDSRVAAYLSALLVEAGQRYSLTARATPEEQGRHLGAILAAAREHLRPTATVLTVVVLPGRGWIDGTNPRSAEREQMLALARQADLPILDPGPMLHEAARRGQELFLGPPERNDPHFDPTGHRLLAEWLHESRPTHPWRDRPPTAE